MTNDLDLIAQALKAQEQPKTETQLDYILMDASSSMSGRWDDSMAATDSYLEGLKTNNVATKVIMATFSSSGPKFQYLRVREAIPAEWPNVYLDDAIDRLSGMTPLYDAINEMGREIKDLNPTKCSILIITDGDENSSRTDSTQAKAILNWLRRKGYQITFLGVDFENSLQAKTLGADDQSMIGLDRKRLKDATSALAEKRHHYDKYGKPMGFTNSEKTELGGLLPDYTAK